MNQLTDAFFEYLNFLGEQNQNHVEDFSSELEDYQHGQDPSLVTMTCSDSRVLQGDIFGENKLGEEFTNAQAGKHVNDMSYWGEIVPHGSIDYIPHHTDSETYIGVIGHTGCGLIGAARDTIENILEENNSVEEAAKILQKVDVRDYNAESEGINTHIALVLDSGLGEDYDRLEEQGYSGEELYNRLVQANVDNQVELLSEADYTDTYVFGAVYDMTGALGEKGKIYLTNIEGETNLEKIGELEKYSQISAGRFK